MSFLTSRLVVAGAALVSVAATSLPADAHIRRHHHHHRHVVVVDAPFTYVETRRYNRVAVDAPFASVRVGGRGTWVRAPFVNLWVPR